MLLGSNIASPILPGQSAVVQEWCDANWSKVNSSKNVSPVSSELVGSQEILFGHGQDDDRDRAKSKSVLTSFDEFVFDQLDIGRVDILLKH